jgi:hypothetical protein
MQVKFPAGFLKISQPPDHVSTIELLQGDSALSPHL